MNTRSNETNVTDKAAIRSLYRSRRQALDPAERARLSALACDHVLETPAWKQAGRVALYIAVRGETDAENLLRAAWATGKSVLLPLCLPGEKGRMRFYPCPGPECLRPGPYGIPEPIAPEEDIPLPAPDLFIVPGVAFTPGGRRLGQGGGYYDRLLAAPENARALRLGLAYDFQILPSLPEEAWDMPMHAVATEKGILWIQ